MIMTNTIVLLSVLLQTNWQDTTVVHDGLQVQVGRVQTNYVIRPGNTIHRDKIGWVNDLTPMGYPILTSQPFFGPYNLVREVPQHRVIFLTNNWRSWNSL